MRQSNSSLIAPRLTQYERHLVKEAKEASVKELGKLAGVVRARHDRVLAEGISGKFGMPISTALRLVTVRHRGVLLPYLDLDFDHLGIVPVATVLADPDRFVGETLADPLEGAQYGRAKAMVMKTAGSRLLIHSFAHGQGFYRLRPRRPISKRRNYASSSRCRGRLRHGNIGQHRARGG